MIIRHKIRQLMSLNQIHTEKGLVMLDDHKNKIITSSCFASNKCIKAAQDCLKSGLLPLKVKGYQLATTLQNPYISIVPKTSMKTPESRRLITDKLLKQAKSLFLTSNNNQNHDMDDLFLLETEMVSSLPEVPSAPDIRRAFNTVKFIFAENAYNSYNNPFLTRIEDSQAYCRKMSRGSIQNLKRKVHYLTFASEMEPFTEYLHRLKDENFNFLNMR